MIKIEKTENKHSDSEDEIDPNENIFGAMIAGKIKANFLYSDSEIVVLQDKKPAGEHHYLVLPREEIIHVDQLRPKHIPLLQKMWEVGKNILIEKGQDPNKGIYVFHLPLYTSVPHLHLHVIVNLNGKRSLWGDDSYPSYKKFSISIEKKIALLTDVLERQKQQEEKLKEEEKLNNSETQSIIVAVQETNN
eukprot:c20711_g1_i2.p1 GENE.c20711_g1_i2~~c20711_g1_i2.p1  ORF type:complete len:198 (+),score=59.44 c20711_g1_i2:22-594(+)